LHAPATVPVTGPVTDTRRFRQALGRFGTGVTVVTTADDAGTLYGVTVSSFNAVSLDPPMVLWSQALHAPSNPVFQRMPRFVVNVLAGSQETLAMQFARPSPDKFAGVDYTLDEDGLPLLAGAVAHFVCSNDFRAYGGDHAIFIARVLRYSQKPELDDPLFFWGGRFLKPKTELREVCT
jgi:flavin reductase (DIM6/NTAB) family NADH-FMN oxidoreductase RutF